MPNLLKKGAPSRTAKHEEKKTFVGIPQQHPNVMEHYLIKPPAPAVISSKTGSGNHRGPVNNPAPLEQFHSNRLLGQEKTHVAYRQSSNAFPAKPRTGGTGLGIMGHPQPVTRSESERTKANKIDTALRLHDFAGRNTNTTTSESSSSSNSKWRLQSDSSNELEAASSTPPKMDIITYYQARGMDYFAVRKKSRQYISRRPTEFSPLTDNEKLTGGAVFWDEYSPPPGYTWKDLEGIPIPEDPMPESPKGIQISPCVLKAANLRFKQKTPVSPSSLPSSQNFRDIIEQLESIQTNRAQMMEERRKKKEEKRKQRKAIVQLDISKDSNDNNDPPQMEVSAVENIDSAEHSGNDLEFPNDEDSFIQRATQLEEAVVAVGISRSKNVTFEMDVDDRNRSRKLSPGNIEIDGKLVDTPVTTGNRMSNSRNKSKRRSHLKRPSGRLDFSNELSGSPIKKSSTTTSPDSEESFNFENSTVGNKTKVGTPKVIGDFFEDDDDDVFSQMPMPALNQLPTEKSSEKTVPVNEKSTELVSENSSNANASVFDGESISDDFLGAIDQLEERAKLAGVQSKVFTSTPMLLSNKTVPSPQLGSALRKSARINTNNLSAIKDAVTPNSSVLNESNETQKGKSNSRLSRSYVRSRK